VSLHVQTHAGIHVIRPAMRILVGVHAVGIAAGIPVQARDGPVMRQGVRIPALLVEVHVNLLAIKHVLFVDC
jgi:hypothetical protein